MCGGRRDIGNWGIWGILFKEDSIVSVKDTFFHSCRWDRAQGKSSIIQYPGNFLLI